MEEINEEIRNSRFLPEERLFHEFELQDPRYIDEFKLVVDRINLENPCSDAILDRYIIFILENLLPWQEPVGKSFNSAFVICGATPKKFSGSGSTSAEVFSDFNGDPLDVQFESLLCQNLEQRRSLSVLKQLNLKYDLYPLSDKIGRRLLYICTAFENNLKFPFIAMCHGRNFKSIVMYGSSQHDRSFRLKIVNQGSVSKLEKLPLLNCLRESHLEGFVSSPISRNSVSSNVSARYDFLPYDHKDKSALIPIKDASVTIDCSWSDVHAVLEPLTAECTCIAKFTTVAGDEKSGASNKYKELKLLKALQESQKNGTMAWINNDSFVFVMKQIKDLVNEEKNSIGRKEPPPLPKTDFDRIEECIVEERETLYFPDKLWLVMKNCSSFGELVDVLKYIYKVLAEVLLQPPFTYSKDVSTISTDIRNMIEKPIICSDLNSTRAAEMLLEIGIEKLRKDYEQIFLGLGLISHDLFSYFVQPALLSPEAITCLEKLHSVLELLLVCKKQLNLPTNVLSEFAGSALKHYTLVPEVDLHHVFNFHIPAIYARPLLNQMRPTIWELSLVSSDNTILKQSIHRFVTTPTHDHIYAPQNYHPKLMLKGASYVYLTGTLIEEASPVSNI